MGRTIIGCCAMLLTLGNEAMAQLRVGVQPGDVVRIESPTAKGVFVLKSVGPDAVVVGSMDSDETYTVLTESLARFDVSRGSRSRSSGFVRGFGWGLLAGGVVGAGLGFADGDDESGFLQMSAGEKALAGGILAGGVAGLVGGGIGAARPGRRWEKVGMQRIGIMPRRGGAAAGVSLSF